ncbi:MAG: tetratricopeptide repeat protein, partial [Pseudomonadota bacterium]|nr:tetratricopeptide repeat protein [Pseudomonadota bacterium]
MLAVMLIEKGDFNRALPYVESVLNRKDINDNVVFSNLDSLVAQIPDVERALAFALSLAKHYPDKYQAHIFAGETAFRAKKAAVALQQVNVALTLNPHSPEAAVLKGVILDRQSPEAAVNFLKVFLNHDNDPNVRLVYARALVSASHFHAARAQFELLAKSNPDNAAINLAVGLLSAQMGDWKVAHAYFLRALTLPVANKEQIKLYLGQTEQALGHPHKALDWYASVIEGPYYVMARIRLAGVLSDEGKNHDAMAVLSSLPVSNLQDRIVVTLAKTELLNKMGKRRRAYVLLDKLYKEAPANPDVLYAHGLAAERIGLEGVFESDMHQLIALKPDDGQAYNALGYTYADHDVHLKEAG